MKKIWNINNQTYNFNGVKRWTKNIDVFRYSALFFPIHFNHHWTMAVVYPRMTHIK